MTRFGGSFFIDQTLKPVNVFLLNNVEQEEKRSQNQHVTDASKSYGCHMVRCPKSENHCEYGCDRNLQGYGFDGYFQKPPETQEKVDQMGQKKTEVVTVHAIPRQQKI